MPNEDGISTYPLVAETHPSWIIGSEIHEPSSTSAYYTFRFLNSIDTHRRSKVAPQIAGSFDHPCTLPCRIVISYSTPSGHLLARVIEFTIIYIRIDDGAVSADFPWCITYNLLSASVGIFQTEYHP